MMIYCSWFNTKDGVSRGINQCDQRCESVAVVFWKRVHFVGNYNYYASCEKHINNSIMLDMGFIEIPFNQFLIESVIDE